MVDNKYNIEVDGMGYILARQPRTGRAVYKRSEAPAFVNKFGGGDPAYRDATFWSHWVQINWQNGARSEQFNDQARFLYDSNVNIHEEGRLSLASKMENAGVVSATGTAYSVCTLSNVWPAASDYRLWAGNGGGGTFEWDTAASSWTQKYVVGNPPINSMIYASGSVWAATGLGSASTSQGVLYRISANGTLQSSAAAGTFTEDAFNVIISSNITGSEKIYLGTTQFTAAGAGVLQQNTSDVVSGTWNTLWASKRAKVTCMTTYNGLLLAGAGGAIGDPTSLNGGIIGYYNGVGTANTTMKTFLEMSHTVPTSMAVFDNLLFIGTAHGHLYVYNGASFDLLFKFWGNDIDMKINQLYLHQDKLHILVSKDSALKGSDTKYAGLWTFNRRGLNLEYKEATNVSAYNQAYTWKNQLIFATEAAGQTYKANENLFQISGSLQSSYFDANLPSLDKLFKETTIIYDYLSASTSATIAYKTDETESFTTLGTALTEGSTSATFQLPTGTSKKKITYQISLSTGNVSATPRIKKVVTKFVVQPDFYHRWQFGVDTSEKVQLLDKTFHPSSGLEIESALFTSRRGKNLITYKDIDYVSTTLAGAIAASATTINGADFSRFPPKGRVRIPSTGEELTFASRTSTTLNTVTRAYKNTTAVSAANAATIDLSYQAIFQGIEEDQFFLNQLADDYNHVTPVTLLEA